jgi:hypothetical protein
MALSPTLQEDIKKSTLTLNELANCSSSRWAEVKFGVPQGSIPGLLFLSFIHKRYN